MEDNYRRLRIRTDGVTTATSMEQDSCERTCEVSMLPLHVSDLSAEQLEQFQSCGLLNDAGEVVLMRDKHEAFLLPGLGSLQGKFMSLDASRPWIIYWVLQSLDLLGVLPMHLASRVSRTLASCQARTGGFGGGPQQLPHCAPTYASVLALLLLGTEEAYAVTDRALLYRFFLSLKHSNGGFKMHMDGEVDVRGTYTAIAVASLLNILTPELVYGVAEYILSTQTYEGGFGGEPWNEAHGGYTFCSLATLCILGRATEARLDDLEWWLVNSQMRLEGGFRGRTNKLVDGCYSFWQGGALALMEYVRKGEVHKVTFRSENGEPRRASVVAAETKETEESAAPPPADESIDAEGVISFSHMSTPPASGAGASNGGSLLFNQYDLQRYILLCTQNLEGGLRDKPGKRPDFYHTCYVLSGLSVAQHCLAEHPFVLGDSRNELLITNPVYNIVEHKAAKAFIHFKRLPCSHSHFMQ